MGMNNQSVKYIFVSSIAFQGSGNENEKKNFYEHVCVYALMADSFNYYLIFLFKAPGIQLSDCPDYSSALHQVYE